ncbi:sigma-54-dependent Fis family transcriptional regulator [Rubellimicrobium rubrum]|uniref:Sigma-54-dependent Fis family transcriptional regulator n=1 Tax=Rubellimicrobium rubrum TaxID=2585369 RepID=A0A5C4MXW8_9RHOB|nr:sigma-54 dependent transcriptional regulator [Rubellimicrobium rubrum]TNC50468.1 sigma-54-dependent Fis family transcriptional regulator [Rubellimicrobium rubrum]
MSKTMKIAIVDDEKDMRQSISQWLALSGFDTETYGSAEDALKGINADYPGIVVSDVRMPGMDGMQFLRKLKSVDSTLPVIMITGHGDVPMAVEAMRVGAFDFLEKPFNPDRMTELAKKATQARRLALDSRALRRELSDKDALMRKLIGASPTMERLREDILDLGQAEGHILIEGETGTGKTLVAHALHAVSARSSRKFVLLSCSAYDDDTLSRRLFGPPQQDEPMPAVEEARGGTLVLEDVEALSGPLQARLLTAINDQGSPAETRIIAICNLQDEGKTCESVLRPDLFYRLAALRITVPPLRQRGEDILTLFTRLSEQFAEEYGCDTPEISAQEAAQLLQAPWPGNVRQLINVAERAVLQNRRGTGTIASLLMADTDDSAKPAMTTEGKPLKEFVEAFERMLIDNTMRRHKGSIVAVMEELCLPRRTLNEKMAKYNLSRSDYL